jgi:glycerophosphoryl diester phosphodiesterase
VTARLALHVGCALAATLLLVACSQPESESAEASKPAAERSFKALRVAHAGGAYLDQTYTNSYEALNLSARKGFGYIELDFSFTSDGHLVCIHDWEESFVRAFGIRAFTAPTLAAFEDLVANKATLENCTLTGLARWLQEHPHIVIISDIKERNLAALAIIADAIPNSGARVIPQIYQPENFAAVKALGFEAMIWTLYRYRGNTAKVLAWVPQLEPPFAITMDKRRARTKLAAKLEPLGIPSYVHTVNDPEEAAAFQNEKRLTEIYTDHLGP